MTCLADPAHEDAHLDRLADELRAMGHDPAVASGPYTGEGLDCPALDTLFLAAPVAQKGRCVQYAGPHLASVRGQGHRRVHDELTSVLASSLVKRVPGYTSLGFPDPRKLPHTTKRQVPEDPSKYWALVGVGRYDVPLSPSR